MRFFSFIPIAFVFCGPWAVIPARAQELLCPAPASGDFGEWSFEDCPPLPSMEIPGREANISDDPNQTEPLPGFASRFGMMPRFDQSNDIMQSMDDLISLLPPVFVHERQTVRMSDRTAEIWVKLPENSESSVSVNFVEYPPEGNFRIFRTRLTTQEPRRFYLSAKRWDVKANRWIELVPMLSLSNEGTTGFNYVELQPGQRQIVQFDNPQMPCVTTAFLFHPDQREIAGTPTIDHRFLPSIDWTSHPDILNISMAATPSRLAAIPDRAFVARITMAVNDSNGLTLATLKPVRVTFKNGHNSIEGEIDFNSLIDGQLQGALVSNSLPPGTYLIKAKMEFTRDMGDTGYSTVSGDLGNDIELTINQ